MIPIATDFKKVAHILTGLALALTLALSLTLWPWPCGFRPWPCDTWPC